MGEGAEQVEYVVQIREDHEIDGVVVSLWRDAVTVNVPPRTKRKTVVEKALKAAAGLTPAPAGEPVRLRVLAPEAARELKATAVLRDPELVIEEVA